MNSKESNKVAMFMATNNVFKTYQAKLSSPPALAQGISEFDANLQQIDRMHQVQLSYSPANSKLKTKEEAEMIQACVQIAAAIYAYAFSTNQPNLQTKVKVTPSTLKSMTDKDLKNACLNIYELGVSLVENIGDYGVNEPVLEAFKSEIDDFVALIAAPRGEIVTRSQATAELKELIAKADELLKYKIDKLMVMLEMQQPKVYKTYKAARIIVDLKGSKVSEEETQEA